MLPRFFPEGKNRGLNPYFPPGCCCGYLPTNAGEKCGFPPAAVVP